MRSDKFWIIVIIAGIVIIGIDLKHDYDYRQAKQECVKDSMMFIEGVCYNFKLR